MGILLHFSLCDAMYLQGDLLFFLNVTLHSNTENPALQLGPD